MSSKIGVFTTKKGKTFPVIQLLRQDREVDKFPLTLGLKKCRLILDNLEDIRKFVSDAEIS